MDTTAAIGRAGTGGQKRPRMIGTELAREKGQGLAQNWPTFVSLQGLIHQWRLLNPVADDGGATAVVRVELVGWLFKTHSLSRGIELIGVQIGSGTEC